MGPLPADFREEPILHLLHLPDSRPFGCGPVRLYSGQAGQALRGNDRKVWSEVLQLRLPRRYDPRNDDFRCVSNDMRGA